MGIFGDLGKALSGGGDMRRKEDKAAKEPSYSAFSFKGLTSSDPANVARNQAAVARINAAEAAKPVNQGNKGKAASPAEVAQQMVAPTPVAAPVAPPTLTPPAAPAPVGSEGPTSAAEAAAVESTQGGRASTIATSALGLLADQEAQGQLRKRRSLMSGGLIQ
jgi:hypothetical protein